jgi:hypothetical protein
MRLSAQSLVVVLVLVLYHTTMVTQVHILNHRRSRFRMAQLVSILRWSMRDSPPS